jgi:hypothetical protein
MCRLARGHDMLAACLGRAGWLAGQSADSLARPMRAVVALGLCEVDDTGRYSRTRGPRAREVGMATHDAYRQPGASLSSVGQSLERVRADLGG